MWFSRKKDKPKPVPEPHPPIVYRADDVPLIRAEKIWFSLGFVNDRLGAIPAIAGYLAMYRDWDREAAEKGVSYVTVPTGSAPSDSDKSC